MASSHRLQVILNHMNGPQNLAMKRTSTNKYLCTMDDTILTPEERDFYEENGYIVIRNIIEDDLLEQLKIRFIDICNGKVDAKLMVLLRDKSLRNIATGEYLYNKATDLLWDDVFVKYCTHTKLLDYIGSFIGPDITAIHSMFINKPPDSGKLTSTHPLHQDLHYFPIRPVEKVVGSWTALEKTTKENGCLHVVPGSHRSILQYHGYPEYDVNYGFHGVRGFDDAPKVYLEMEKGDTVFLHPLILHGSGPNVTKGFRKAISVHYASSHCHYVDVTNTSQELIAKEAQGMAKRVGVTLTHLELLKLRNVLVRGNRGKLLED